MTNLSVIGKRGKVESFVGHAREKSPESSFCCRKGMFFCQTPTSERLGLGHNFRRKKKKKGTKSSSLYED